MDVFSKNSENQTERIIMKLKKVRLNLLVLRHQFKEGNNKTVNIKKYFSFNAQQFFIEVDAYHDESVAIIKQIIAENPIQNPPHYVYERILNSDDYLFTANRLSTVIFEIKD